MKSTRLVAGFGALMSIGLFSGCSTTNLSSQQSSSNLLSTARIEPVQRTDHGTSALEADYALGKRYLSQGLPDMAVEAFERALQSDRDNAEIHNGLAHAYMLKNDLVRAEEQLQQAVTANPRASHLQSNLGYVLMQRGRLRDSASALAKAIQLDPDNARAQQNWQTLRARFGDGGLVSSAAKHLVPAVATGPVVTTSVKPNAGQPLPAPQSQSVLNIDFDRPAVAPVLTARFGDPVIEPVQPRAAIAEPSLALTPLEPAAGATKQRESAFRTARNEPAPASDAVAIRTRIAPSPQITAAPYISRVEIANGNGVAGQAARVRARLSEFEVMVYKITNASRYNYKVTQILYRESSREQASALSRMLPGKIELVPFQDSAAPHGVDVRVVIGADLSTPESVREIRALPARPTASYSGYAG